MLRVIIAIAASLALWACAKEPDSFVTSRATSATATVQSVNQADRNVVVLTSDGQRLLVETPSVSNFDQINPGDLVVITYHQGFVAGLRRPGDDAGSEVNRTATSGGAPTGEVPTKALARSVSATVQIQAVDPSSNTVSFKRPDGITRTLTVQDPRAKEFVSRLAPGDQVDVTYREAAAVSIQPARR